MNGASSSLGRELEERKFDGYVVICMLCERVSHCELTAADITLVWIYGSFSNTHLVSLHPLINLVMHNLC